MIETIITPKILPIWRARFTKEDISLWYISSVAKKAAFINTGAIAPEKPRRIKLAGMRGGTFVIEK